MQGYLFQVVLRVEERRDTVSCTYRDSPLTEKPWEIDFIEFLFYFKPLIMVQDCNNALGVDSSPSRAL